MQINFQKLPQLETPFKYKKDDFRFDGFFVKKAKGTLKLEGTIEGFLCINCDICAEEFNLPLDEEVKLKIVNRILDNTEDLDTIEVLKDEVDLKEIIDLELENIKLDYNYCNKCKKLQI